MRPTTPVYASTSRAARPTPRGERQLSRELGVFSATLLVVGGIIGSGIFFTPAEVARALPDGPWILLIWAIGGVVALAGALTYAELGAMMPEAGGAYVYIREAFGGLPAFLYGWMLLASIGTGALAAVAMGFGGYVARFVDLTPLGGPIAGQIAVATATIAVLTITNILGVKPGAFLQNVLTVVKVVALAGLILGGFALWSRLGAPPTVADAPAPRPLLPGLASAFVAVLFTIGGWQQMNMVAGEIREPSRAIPRALIAGIAIVIACYLGVNAVYLRALGRDGMAVTTAVAADAAGRLGGSLGTTVLSIAAMLSILGFVNVVVLATPRIFFAMALDKAFFAAAARVHPRFGTPHVAIAILGGWAIVLLLATRGRIGDLLSGVVFADWIFFGLGGASVFALRRKDPGADRPYRTLGYPVVPAVFVIAAVAGVVSSYIAAPGMSLAGTVLVLLGVLVHRLTRRRLAGR